MTANHIELDLPVFYQNAIEEAVRVENFQEFTIVAKKSISKGDGFMGDIYRITVNGVKNDGSKDCLHLLLKTASKIKIIRNYFSIPLFYDREIFAYEKLFPMYDQLQDQFIVPQTERFHYAKLFKAANEDFNELLIFEDLNAKGFILHNKQKSFDYDHLSLLVKTLARFHALSIVLKAKEPKVFEQISLQVSNHMDYSDDLLTYLGKTSENLSSIIEDEEERRRSVDYLKMIKSELKRFLNSETTAPYNVICHGDSWNNNFLFKYNGGKVIDLRIIDFQIIRYTSPVTDLAYILFLGTDKATRDNHYEELLTMYYDTLNRSVSLMGVDISKYFPENVYRKQIKSIMPYGFLMACVFLPISLENTNDIPNLEDFVEDKPEGRLTLCDLFIDRIRDIIKFSIKKDII